MKNVSTWRAFRPVLLFGLALAFVVTQWSVVEAHAILLSASPNPNGLFPADQPPIQVQLTFSEEVVAAFSAIRVLNEAGDTLTDGNLSVTNSERTRLATALPALQPGTYTVAWNVVSAVDGHASSGAYAFGVGVTPIGQSTTQSPAVTIAGFGSRWLGLTGQILLLGLFVFYLFVWRPAQRSASALDNRPNAAEDGGSYLDPALKWYALRVGWIGLALVMLGLILALAGQSAAFGASSAPQLVTNLRAWLAARYGSLWTMRLLLCVALAFNLADLGLDPDDRSERSAGERHSHTKNWAWWAGLMLSVGLGLTATFVSHSAALPASGQLATVSDGAHVLAAGAWVGGLVQLLLATRLTRKVPLPAQGELNLHLVLNFSLVGAIALGLLLMSGGYLAWQHIGSWEALFKTPYGQALLAKVGLAVPALAAASLNLLLIRPRLEAARSLPEAGQAVLHRRFGRLVLIESGFTLAVIGVTGLLGELQPGRDALLLAEQSQVRVSQPADDLNVTLTVEPGQWGQTNSFDIQVLDRRRQPLSSARDVALRFTFLDRPLGTNMVLADPVGNGHFRAVGAYLTLGGTWQVEVAIRRPDAYDAFAAFRLETTAQGLTKALDASNWTERLIGWLSVEGGWAVAVALFLFALAWAVMAVLATGGRLTPWLGISMLPSLLAVYIAALQIARALGGAPTIPSGDPRALAWLAKSEAAMNRLTSLQLLRTTRGDSGAVLTETVRFQAPDLFDDQMSNGAENMAQGSTRYYRGPQDTQWQAVRLAEVYVFPDFNFSSQAVNARLGRQEEVDGRPAQQIVFTIYLLRNPIPYARWIDVDTKLILRETMDAPGHHMVSNYHDFNVPVTIATPSPAEVGPTPTVTIP